MLHFFQNNKEKHLEISLFSNCVPKILMIWSTDIECDRLKLVILGYFLPFHSSKSLKNPNFEKMKQNAGDTIILHMCTKNHNYIRCSSWDIYRVRETEFFVICAIFCPFTPLMSRKLKIWKNEKTLGDIILLHMCNINDNHMTYDSWDIRHNWVFCRFELFLPFSLPNNLKNQNFEKNEKTFWRYYNFTFAYYKWGSHHVWLQRYGVQQTELFVILDHFLPFYPPPPPPLNIPEKKIFWKNENKTWRYITLHLCTTNDNHTMYVF